MVSKTAFVLGAGFGKRLRPYTEEVPKPMVEVDGRSLIYRTLDHLEEHGITDCVVNTHYLADKLENHLQERKTPALHISREEDILDTGLGVKRTLDYFSGEDFFILSGDGLWTEGPGLPILQRMEEMWNPQKMDILLKLQPVESMVLTKGVGDYDILPDGRIVRSQEQTGAYMFASTRIVSPRIFEDTPDQPFSFLTMMDRAQKAGRLYGIVHEGDWHHISTPDDLETVRSAFKVMKKTG